MFKKNKVNEITQQYYERLKVLNDKTDHYRQKLDDFYESESATRESLDLDELIRLQTSYFYVLFTSISELHIQVASLRIGKMMNTVPRGMFKDVDEYCGALTSINNSDIEYFKHTMLQYIRFFTRLNGFVRYPKKDLKSLFSLIQKSLDAAFEMLEEDSKIKYDVLVDYKLSEVAYEAFVDGWEMLNSD